MNVYGLYLVLLFEQFLFDNDKTPKQLMENEKMLMELPNPTKTNVFLVFNEENNELLHEIVSKILLHHEMSEHLIQLIFLHRLKQELIEHLKINDGIQ